MSRDVGPRDFYHAYKDTGGTAFNRDSFADPYGLLFNKLLDYMLEENVDIKAPYINYIFGIRMVHSNKKTVDWGASWKIWREKYAGKTDAEIKHIKGKPTKTIKCDKLMLLGHRPLSGKYNKWFRLKNNLYSFQITKLAKKKLTKALMEGELYMYR